MLPIWIVKKSSSNWFTTKWSQVGIPRENARYNHQQHSDEVRESIQSAVNEIRNQYNSLYGTDFIDYSNKDSSIVSLSFKVSGKSIADFDINDIASRVSTLIGSPVEDICIRMNP
jgi:hypothetical protein